MILLQDSYTFLILVYPQSVRHTYHDMLFLHSAVVGTWWNETCMCASSCILVCHVCCILNREIRSTRCSLVLKLIQNMDRDVTPETLLLYLYDKWMYCAVLLGHWTIFHWHIPIMPKVRKRILGKWPTQIYHSSAYQHSPVHGDIGEKHSLQNIFTLGSPLKKTSKYLTG